MGSDVAQSICYDLLLLATVYVGFIGLCPTQSFGNSIFSCFVFFFFLINCLLLKKFITVWLLIVGILKSTQTFEKDPHNLLSDEEESALRAGVETEAKIIPHLNF